MALFSSASHAPFETQPWKHFAPRPFRSLRPHSRAARLWSLQGKWQEERADLPEGSLFVPIAQGKARLVMALLEPQSADSYAAWGFFNGAFEQKEYMEAYVAEDVAREMLERDPAVAAEFARRLASDAEFAKSPQQRLDFFYRRHAAWDRRYDLYPVYRTSSSRPQ